MENSQRNITYFSDSIIQGIDLPTRFTFPFFYEPHPLSQIAATELQHYLETQTHLEHNFGLTPQQEGMAIGKMFGVLVVQDTVGKLGYLSAFSGKLADSNDHPGFVPPVFDMLAENSFFLKEIHLINAVNHRIREREADESYLSLQQKLEQAAARSSRETTDCKQQLKQNKDNRHQLRQEQKSKLSREEYQAFEADLIKQSLHDKRQLKHLTSQWEQTLIALQTALTPYESELETLRNERKQRSAALQQQLFAQYTFLNKHGQSKSLQDIFSRTAFGKPPSAAGECATPKLLQYAFRHGYTPIAMAEFWWGASPKSEIRKHKQYYPACTGKCKPILAHMLEGIMIEDNPFLRIPEENHKLEIIYQDESIMVVNKPAGLRSVPGVDITESVYTRLKHLLVNIEPLIVHRLDMDTSGLLVVAKTPQAHKHIQRQFLQGAVRKRYRALLAKVIPQEEGEIRLPLAADLFNRPRQLVCYRTGKKSLTKYKVVKTYTATTRIDFWPLTGRTHQLRMHAAHQLGLDAPIVGDDLYGTPAERMYLHAAHLEFIHPKTKEKLSFEAAENF